MTDSKTKQMCIDHDAGTDEGRPISNRLLGSCDRCKHWTQERDVHLYPLGSCDHPKMMKGYHIKVAQVQPDGILVEDDEGWGFYTAPKFCCVHFRT